MNDEWLMMMMMAMDVDGGRGIFFYGRVMLGLSSLLNFFFLFSLWTIHDSWKKDDEMINE